MENEWLLEAIQFSLRASTSTTIKAENRSPAGSPPPQGDSPRQRLIDGIVYSRKFILTYHIFVLAFIFALSALHWSTEVVRWRTRRASRWQLLRHDERQADGGGSTNVKSTSWAIKGAAEGVDEILSSGSSATAGTSSPPLENIEDDERSPLLPASRTATSRRTLLSTLKALLMYQPQPIPLFNKLLPSNGSSVVILLFIGLNIFYCSYNMEFSLRNVFVLADRWGLMFVANLPLLYLLAAKNQPLKFLTGRSYESLNIFHRRLGELLCLQALIHGLAMTATWYIIIRPTGRLNFKQYIFLPVTYCGLGAFFAYEILYLTALGSFRQRFYEVFLAFHVVLQIIALVFVFFHHKVGEIYVGIALVIFITDRLIYRLWAKATTVTASAKIMEDGETVKLSTVVSILPKGQFIKSGWKPTDHVFLTAAALGKEHVLQAHPFTIASAAPTSDDEPAALELLIRAQFGFSRDLLNYVHRHNTLTLRLDGPYGSSDACHLLESSSLAIVVAGGSGIAVAWPLIAHLIHVSSPTSLETPRSSPYIGNRKVILIWVIHQDTHVSWLSPSSLAYAKSQGVEVVVSKPTEEVGRPDLKAMIESVVDKYAAGRSRTGVVASGPDGMGRLVRNTCAGLVREGRDVGVVIEKFGW